MANAVMRTNRKKGKKASGTWRAYGIYCIRQEDTTPFSWLQIKMNLVHNVVVVGDGSVAVNFVQL